MLTCTDKFTHYSWIFLTEDWKTLESYLTEWKSSVETQSDKKLIVIHSDQGSEYLELEKKLLYQDIKIKFMVTYTSEQNDISEHLNCNLVKTTSVLLFDIRLSHIFWDEAITHANWLHNRLLLSDSEVINLMTSHQTWFYDKVSNLSHTKVFSSLMSVFISTKSDRVKLDRKIFNSILLNYQSEVMNHRV